VEHGIRVDAQVERAARAGRKRARGAQGAGKVALRVQRRVVGAER
jgi:hypothetical protein